MARKRPEEPESEGGSPAWMTTFGDMMTLLLTFFVLLYSMSSIDVAKFEQAMGSLQGHLGVLSGGKAISTQQNLDRGDIGQNFTPITSRILRRAMTEVEAFVEEEGVGQDVSTEMTQRGLVIRFTGQLLFDVGEANIRSNGEEVLLKISQIIKEVPNDVLVEGHTDNLPINTSDYPSNWELSTARATRVIRYFIETENIDPDRLSASGYSEYQPLRPNDTSGNRAENRRVEIVLLNPDYMGPPNIEQEEVTN
ncbi:MAG: flagellar motor protein MotB [Bacillota bacterium]